MIEPLYKVQRRLSRRRLNAVNKGLIGLIDIGSAKLVCFILQFTPDIETSEYLREDASLSKSVAFRVIVAAILVGCYSFDNLCGALSCFFVVICMGFNI